MNTKKETPAIITLGQHILILLVLFATSGNAQFVSKATGDWNSASTWAPVSVPTGGATVVIDGAIILDKNLTGGSGISGSVTINSGKSLIYNNNKSMVVKSGGVLMVYGILDLYDLDFANGSSVYVAEEGAIIVRHNFSNRNNSNNVVIDGSLTIHGAAFNGNGGVITGSGNINTLGGAFTGSGLVGPSVVLPVELVSFTAEPHEKNVHISWITASETNNDFFTIERSSDGIHFVHVGKIKGVGNSVVQNDYSYVDKASHAVTYYRLQQTDFNGVSAYVGPTIVVRPGEAPVEAVVYPNPVLDSNLYVKWESAQDQNPVEVTLTDMSGNMVYTFSTVGSTMHITIPQAVLRPGIYVLVIRTGTTETAKKIVVK